MSEQRPGWKLSDIPIIVDPDMPPGTFALRSPVLPNCDQPDGKHDPPGPRRAAYLYQFALPDEPPGRCKILCVECCARMRFESEQPGANHVLTPVATKITVLVDPNTLKRAI